ncbi:unnamed protein product [Trypanosoma congolense IL3000]|uniref:WGS project CAEQ00000000 data, annotated contig 454 n=1 Tax=Trypanosoma congolense (strain IL3000) TaxID=1068625 RepID=F9WG22_TRYCI|nr:unnamed protein product [Trypanosoma congolense IL3000]
MLSLSFLKALNAFTVAAKCGVASACFFVHLASPELALGASLWLIFTRSPVASVPIDRITPQKPTWVSRSSPPNMPPCFPTAITWQQEVVAPDESVNKHFSLFANLLYPISSIISTSLISPSYISTSCMPSEIGSKPSSLTLCPLPRKKLPKLIFPAAHVFPMQKCPSSPLELIKTIIIFYSLPTNLSAVAPV